MDIPELKERLSKGEALEDVCRRAVDFAEACESERDTARLASAKISEMAADDLKKFEDLLVRHTALQRRGMAWMNLCLAARDKLVGAGFFARLGKKFRQDREELDVGIRLMIEKTED